VADTVEEAKVTCRNCLTILQKIHTSNSVDFTKFQVAEGTVAEEKVTLHIALISIISILQKIHANK